MIAVIIAGRGKGEIFLWLSGKLQQYASYRDLTTKNTKITKVE